MRYRDKLINFHLICLLAIVLFWGSVPSQFSYAANFVIADGDTAGLIAAIETANANGEADVIQLASGGNYPVIEGNYFSDGYTAFPPIEGDITIQGNGAALNGPTGLNFSGFRLFAVDFSGNLTLENITLNGGNIGQEGGGGAVFNLGTLTVTNSTLSNASVIQADGSSILSQGTTIISGSTISDNELMAGSGTVFHGGSGSLEISNSIITNNIVDFQGGGIFSTGTTVISNSEISNNVADSGGAGGEGGGIYSSGGNLTITNSTIVNNTAGAEGNVGLGSGIYHVNGNLTLTNTTLSNNTAGDSLYVTGGSVNIRNSFIVDSGTNQNCNIVGGTFNGTVANMADDNSCLGFDEVTLAELNLGSLTGSPAYIPLLDGSVAIDAADGGFCPSTDQRGEPRPFGPACDIGAYEGGVAGPGGDTDGVDAATEDGAPNGGDGNNDGIPDSEQNNVSSLPNSVDAQYITLVSSDGTSLSNIASIGNPSPGDTPAGATLPFGLFEFTVEGVTTGGSTTVTLILPTGAPISTFFKYGPTPDNTSNHWYDFMFDGSTGAEISGNIITLHYIDGQRGDSDLTSDGTIIDPAGPIVCAGGIVTNVDSSEVFCTIQAAIDDPDTLAGHTIQASAGLYTESVVIDKQITLNGAGNGTNPVVDTVIDPASPGITITSGGTSAANRLVISNLTVTGATGGGFTGTGILLLGPSAIEHVTFDTISSVSNDGHGIGINSTGTVGDIEVIDSDLSSNGGTGFRIPTSISSFDGLFMMGGTVDNNGNNGVNTGPSGSPNVDNISIIGTSFTGNGSSVVTGDGDISLFGFNGNASIQNVTINADAYIALQIRGVGVGSLSGFGPIDAAGTITLDNVTINGTTTYSAISLMHYSDVSGISFNDVTVDTTSSFGLYLETLADGLNLGNTEFDGTYALQRTIANNSVGDVDATGTTFVGAADNFAIEDRIGHAIDVPGGGLVTWVANNVYITVNSFISPLTSTPSIQRGVNAASAGWTVNIGPGTFTEGSQVVINKTLTMLGQGSASTTLKPGYDTASASSNGRGWFLVNAGVTFDFSDVTMDGTGNKVWQAIRSLGGGSVDSVVFTQIKFDPSSAYAGTAIAAFGDAPVDVTNSDFSEIGRIGIQYFGTGVNGSSATGNTYTGKGVGNWLDYGIEANAGAVVTITGNVITDNLGVAASDGSASAGILVSTFSGGGTQATITENTIKDSTYGVAVGFGVADTSLVVANYNNLNDNVFGIISTAPVVNGILNWWGDASGPDTVGPGAGSKVSTNVIFCPWLDDEFAIGDPVNAPGGIVTNIDTGEIFCTIQAAIDDSDTVAGHTIYAAAGTYNENVVINKAVKLDGDGIGQTIIQGDGVACNVGGVALNTSLSNVSLTDFTVTGFLDGIQMFTGPLNNILIEDVEASDNCRHGIWTQAFGVNGFTVNRVDASNNNQAPNPAANGRGLWMINGVKQNITVTDSTFNDNRLVGLDISDGNVTGLTITGNNVTGNGDSGIGVLGAKGPGATLVYDNIVTDNGRFGIEIKNSTGNGASSGAGSVVVSTNNVSRTLIPTHAGDYAGIAVFRRDPTGLNADQPSGVVVTGNTVTDFVGIGGTGEGFGIVVEGTNHIVNDNDVTGNDVGILIQAGNTYNVQSTPFFDRGHASNTSVQVFDNTVTGNGEGIRSLGSATGTVTGNVFNNHVESNTNNGVTVLNNFSTSLLVNENNITANGALGVQNQGTNVLNATLNWWGSATGPGTVGPGSGDEVSLNVIFCPWLDNEFDSGGVGFGPVYNVDRDEYFCTIQAAIDDDDTVAGDTIEVSPGTYVELVTDYKGVHLVGTGGALVTTIKTPATIPVASNILSAIVTVRNGVSSEIEGFTIAGPGPGGCGTIGYGIYVREGAYANIHDNRILDIRDEPFSGCQNGTAIQVGRSDDATSGTADITDNIIEGYQKNGITVSNAGSSANVTGNTVTGAGATGVIAQNGIQFSTNTTGTMTTNTVEGHYYTGAMWVSTGILSFGNVTSDTNTLTNNQVGIYQIGSTATHKNNIITQSFLGGDYMWGAIGVGGDLDFLGNIIDGDDSSDSYGLGLYDDIGSPATHLATKNIITDWIVGVDIGNTNFASVLVNRNSITSNADGLINYDVFLVDGTCNWWGAADGPSGAGSGSGDSVSANVNFTPWLTTPDLDGPCGGGYGKIIVEKQTIPDGDSTIFDFTASYDNDGFPLTDDDQNDSGFIAPDTYSVSEIAEPGWTSNGSVCTSSLGDDEMADAIELDADEIVTCVFTNTRDEKVIIIKDTQPDDGQDFGFDINGDDIADFTVDDDGVGSNSFEFAVNPGDFIEVYEIPVAGWSPYQITCDDNNSNGSPIERRAIVNVEPGEIVTCTFTNVPSGTVTVVKNAVPNDAQDFGFDIDGDDVADFYLDDDDDDTYLNEYSFEVIPGTFIEVSELAVPDWALTDVYCDDLNSTGSEIEYRAIVNVEPGEHVTCTFINTKDTGKLTVIKQLTNDNGGNAVVGDFPLFVDGNSLNSGDTISVTVGEHTVTEDNLPGYEGSFGGDCDANGKVTIAEGDDKTCYVINDDQPAKITLSKQVINDDGGDADENDFGLTIGGTPVSSGGSVAVNSNTPIAINEAGLAGYAFVEITGDAQCPAVLGGAVTLDEGQEISCTIVNDDAQSTLTLYKEVTNDNGGNAGVNDFGLTIGGSPVSSGQAVEVNSNTPIAINEVGLTGYEFVEITGDAQCPDVLGGTVTLSEGDNVSCTIVNDDQPAKITLSKQVINDDGGDADENDFGLTIGGTPVSSGGSVVVNSNTPIAINEAGLAGYAFVEITGDAQCPDVLGGTVTLDEGEAISCTIVNDDAQSTLKLYKQVTNDNGGNAGVNDFGLTIGGSPVSSGQAVEVDANTPIAINEAGLSGYEFVEITGDAQCPDILGGTVTLSEGDNVSCTIVNDDQPAKITLSKEVTNDNGGNAGVNDFGLTIGGTPVSSGGSVVVNSNTPIAINEAGLTGYEFVEITGDAQCPDVLGGTVTLDEGEAISCTIVNNDKPARITLSKQVINNSGGGAGENAFGLTIGGTPVNSGDTLDVDSNTPVAINEAGLAGYAFVEITGDAQCPAVLGGTVTLDEGEAISCTIVNDDLLSKLTIDKTGDAGPVQTGGTVNYIITVKNEGDVDLHNVTISDPLLGINTNIGTLGVGQSHVINDSYGPVSTANAPTLTNTATADSDETGPVSDSHSVDVEVTVCQPGDLYYNPEADLSGSLPSRTNGVVTNSSVYCAYEVGMASYQRYDASLATQVLYDYDWPRIVQPGETIYLYADYFTECAVQVDLFYGTLITDFGLQGPYGTRLLANRLSTNLPYCAPVEQLQLQSLSVPETPVDSDGDGIADIEDVCPYDAVHDSVGDPCNHDEDGDSVADDVDCNALDSTVYPGAVEVPDDGIDQDCDGGDAVTPPVELEAVEPESTETTDG